MAIRPDSAPMSSPSRSTKRRPASARLLDLAKPTGRVEFLDTPAGYQWDDTRDNRKIPFVFRTSDRFPPSAPPLGDSLECNMSAIEPKPHVAVIADAPRWPPPSAVKSDQYDVERGLRAIEPKTFAATFATSSRPEPRVASPHMPDQDHLTIAHTRHLGGDFTTEQRNTSEHFLLRSNSPGPIYQLNFAAIDPKSTVTVFSSQPREPHVKSLGPGPLAYADAVSQADRLSIHRTSPSVRIGDVPNSSSMPFPYTMQNFWNSRSMRTNFCKSYAVLDRHAKVVAGGSAPSPAERPRMTSTPPDDSSGAIRRFVERTRAATPAACGRCAPWESPFSRPSAVSAQQRGSTTVKPVVVRADRIRIDAEEGPAYDFEQPSTSQTCLDRTASVPSRPSSSLRIRAVHASSEVDVPAVAPVNRFDFAKKYPKLIDDGTKADGMVAGIIAEARKTHPESWRQRKGVPAVARPSAAAANDPHPWHHKATDPASPKSPSCDGGSRNR